MYLSGYSCSVLRVFGKMLTMTCNEIVLIYPLHYIAMPTFFQTLGTQLKPDKYNFLLFNCCSTVVLSLEKRAYPQICMFYVVKLTFLLIFYVFGPCFRTHAVSLVWNVLTDFGFVWRFPCQIHCAVVVTPFLEWSRGQVKLIFPHWLTVPKTPSYLPTPSPRP